jgi:cell division protein FtsL
MSALHKLCVAVVAAVLFCSAIGVVWTKHQSRVAFVQLQRLQADRDRLDIEWGQLKLEQSAAATPARVEQIAHSQLRMTIPQPAEVTAVRVAPP